jgi:superkiller protein 3
MWRKYLFALIVGFSLCSISSVLAYSVPEVTALEQRNDWNAVVRYAQAWTQAEPNNSNAWGALSVAYFFGLNQPDLALEPAKRGIALAPKEPGAWNALGSIYRKLKRYSDAVEALNHAVDLAPHNGIYWNNLAAAYSEQGNYTMTLQTLQKQAQSAGPYQNELLWYNLGNAFLTVAASTRVGPTAGRSPNDVLREAVNAYQRCLRMNPRYANAWNNLGMAAQALGDTQSALNDYQHAASLGNPVAQKNYIDLQNTIAAQKAAADAGAAADSQIPSWIKNLHQGQWNWDHDLGLQATRARPQ